MNTYKTISSENLHNLLIVEGIENSIYQKAEILQIAICDYPGPVQEPIDYLNILENEIGNPLTFDRINAFQSKLDLKTDAWKAESLSVVLHTFNDDKNVTLNELLEELSSFYFTNINNFGSL
jgi:hypothetical protein